MEDKKSKITLLGYSQNVIIITSICLLIILSLFFPNKINFLIKSLFQLFFISFVFLNVTKWFKIFDNTYQKSLAFLGIILVMGAFFSVILLLLAIKLNVFNVITTLLSIFIPSLLLRYFYKISIKKALIIIVISIVITFLSAVLLQALLAPLSSLSSAFTVPLFLSVLSFIISFFLKPPTKKVLRYISLGLLALGASLFFLLVFHSN